MANKKHLDILKKGVMHWNTWRKQYPEISPDLRDADLFQIVFNGADMSRVDLRGADLRNADLSDANLSNVNRRNSPFYRTDLSGTSLGGADLSYADLSHADFSGADLKDVDFSGSNLYNTSLNKADLGRANLRKVDLSKSTLQGADLFVADLREANLNGVLLNHAHLAGSYLTGVDLSYANLNGTDLSGADLTGVLIGGTVFGNNDLRNVNGLETIKHGGPSTIGTDTISRSGGKIPVNFLREAGLTDPFIKYTNSLAQHPIEYYTCFISYSSNDQNFAEHIYSDLQVRGVRCWFAPEDMKTGDKIRQRIDETIHLFDKLLLVLSQHSVTSTWVEFEVEAALAKENNTSTTVLFPIRLDDTIMESTMSWAAHIRRTRHITNFTEWNQQEGYQKAFARLLRDLKAKP